MVSLKENQWKLEISTYPICKMAGKKVSSKLSKEMVGATVAER